MDLRFYLDSMRRYGAVPSVGHAAYRIVNRVTRVAVWHALGITVDRLPPGLARSARDRGRMLDAESLRAYAADPAAQLSHRFLDEAAWRGDRCMAIFDGDLLASYGWYSTRPTRLSEIDDDLVLHFDASYTYMHNAFTRASHRGQRLHALGMAAALIQCTSEGQKGLVSYVDATNYASLHSCKRMGYGRFGALMVLRIGGRYVCRASAGCVPYGFEIVHEGSTRSTQHSRQNA